MWHLKVDFSIASLRNFSKPAVLTSRSLSICFRNVVLEIHVIHSYYQVNTLVVTFLYIVHFLLLNFFSSFSIDQKLPAEDEIKFIVFQSMLISLFTMFCFKCHHKEPSVEMFKKGTIVQVLQTRDKCNNSFKWSSQPLLLGKHPARNILLRFATLAGGASITQMLLVMKHMGVSCYKARTFFRHQKKFIFPAILYHWKNYQENMLHVKT